MMFDQTDYDLLIEFCDWLRQNHSVDLGEIEYDSNDEIVQKFLTEDN